MNLVMQMVRQILMLLLPKLMANPSLMASFTGGKPMVPPMPAPPAMGGMGGMGAAAAMAAMGARPNAFAPAAPAPAYGANAHGAGMYMPTGDAFKDMRIGELLRDPTLGFVTDPRVSAFIPPPGAMYGLSLGDRVKDYIQYTLMRRRAPGRPLNLKENDLLHLIGDPPKPHEVMPTYAARYGGVGAAPMGGMGGMASMAAGMAAMANMNQAMAGMNPAAPGVNPPAVG